MPNSLPASVFKIVITRWFLISDCRCRSCAGFCQSVYGSGLPALSTMSAKRAVLVLSNFTERLRWLTSLAVEEGNRISPQLLNYSTSQQQKSARELRQGGSNYRCCIPALAGFVSSQSIASDGEKTLPQGRP